MTATAERTLILVLDAVPYSLVDELKRTSLEDGTEFFAHFQAPVPLISTFPATTSVAMSGIFKPLGLRRGPGYEARFFDRARAEVRGGGALSYQRLEFPWRGFFDWRSHSVWHNMVGSLVPVRDSKHRIGRALQAFADSDQPIFLAHIGSTDRVGHLHSPTALIGVLRHLDAAVSALLRREQVRVVLLSDHGMAGGSAHRNIVRPVRRRLKETGYRVGRRLRRPKDVALTPYGLVSSFEVYTQPQDALQVARGLAAVTGVDLCVLPDAPDAGAWRVVSSRGEAIIRRRTHGEQSQWSYEMESGDPLGYQPLYARLESLARSAENRAVDWYSDEDWFRVTGESAYPDALYRVATSFELVENPASLVCSAAPGYLYGSSRASTAARFSVGRLRWTHGALHRDGSRAFLMSNCPDWTPPAAARFDLALARLSPCWESEEMGVRPTGPLDASLSSP